MQYVVSKMIHHAIIIYHAIWRRVQFGEEKVL